MKYSKYILLIIASYLFCPNNLSAQECKDLPSISPDGLVSYLADVVPNEENADCITFAIKTLSRQRYQPAIPVLVRLLDFHRPPSSIEKSHVLLRPRIIEELYPAAEALEEIGKYVLPAVLDVIKSSSSAKVRENAVAVWMDIYKYEPAKGVALLQQAAVGVDDPIVKENLKFALSKATMWCNPKDKKRCEAAALIPKS